MDFARKQLEKYGWTDGKGLGKHENGISEALKPKLKRSVTGVGHDPASEFNEHWWTALYDKAAGNVEVQEKNGKTKRIKSKDNEFVITNSTWKLNRKMKNIDKEEQYSENFVRTAVLASGGSKTEKIKESDSEEEAERKDVFKMTDEELFAACEGRTAHKGARHGLKALGKLARIAEQEAKLLTQSKYNGYSQANNMVDKVVEDMNLDCDSEVTELKKKKKKRKRCCSHEDPVNNRVNDCDMAESIEAHENSLPEKNELIADDGAASVSVNNENSRKLKKKNLVIQNMNEITNEIDNVISEKKKKRKAKEDSTDFKNVDETEINAFDNVISTKKTKKNKFKNV